LTKIKHFLFLIFISTGTGTPIGTQVVTVCLLFIKLLCILDIRVTYSGTKIHSSVQTIIFNLMVSINIDQRHWNHMSVHGLMYSICYNYKATHCYSY